MRHCVIIIAALLVAVGCSSGTATQSSPTMPSSPTPTVSHVATAAARHAGQPGGGAERAGAAKEPARSTRSPKLVAEPRRLTIRRIDVDATLVGVGLKDDGTMQTPAYDSNQAGWYTKGPRPGQPGPAVIVAHVDSKTGPDVFYRLRNLERGDTITVTDSAGVDHTFAVRRTETAGKRDLPYDQIWSQTHAAVLRLITCAGPYDQDAGEYEDNLIVFAR